MVDDVAWGVGWGSEGDDATPEPAEHALAEANTLSSPTSWSSRPSDIEMPTMMSPDEAYDDRRRSSVDAASRRSLSRAQRSFSRAPLHVRRASMQRDGRSMSRNRQHSFSPAPALSHSIMSLQSSNSTSSMWSSEVPLDSDAFLSPSHSMERGRQMKKAHTSRSPSPSVLPTTPVDFGAMRFPSSIPIDSPVDGMSHVLELDHRDKRENSRGRNRFAGGMRSSGLRVFDSDADALEEEALGWKDRFSDAFPTGGGKTRRGHFFTETRKTKRAGSTPPAPLSPSSWSNESTTSSGALRLSDAARPRPYLSPFTSRPIPIARKSTTRSRSMEHQYRG